MTVRDRQFSNRFLRSIEIRDYDNFDIQIISVVKSSFDPNYLTLTIRKFSPWDYKLLYRFMNGIIHNKTYRAKVIFTYEAEIHNEKLDELISDWYFDNAHISPNYKLSYSKDERDRNLSFIFNTKEEEDKFQKYKNDLYSFLHSINYDFNLNSMNLETNNTKVVEEEISEPKAEEIPTNKEEDFEGFKKQTEENIENDLKTNYEKMLEERRQNELFKKGDYQETKIIQIDTNSGAVDVNGKVFEVTLNQARTGRTICRVGLDDGTNAIYATFISNDSALKPEDLAKIQAGQNLRVEGRVTVDKFRKDTMIMGHYFFLLPPTPMRDDLSKDKRVELHLHTKMSEMDGVSFFKDYAKLAKHMGHKAIAITDHGNVQGFPDAQRVAKDVGIKVIYGSELYVIDDCISATINANDELLSNATYCCLDTETTGLNNKFDKITEFGAVKIVKGVVTERMDILINPEIPIPLKIQQKTHITDEMVKDKPTIKEALPDILKFIGNSVIVAHNLKFDYGMLNEAMMQNGFGQLKLPGIDTLTLSKYLFPDKTKHSLGATCKYYDVEYKTDENDDEEEVVTSDDASQHAAHRADYDAEVLANVWLIMRVNFVKDNPMTKVSSLGKLPLNQQEISNLRDCYHVVALVKNKNGVKPLYQIISDAHINNMGFHSYTTKSFLDSHRENLLLGSACFNGEVFQLAMHSDINDGLRKAIKYFDYIEIQPLENYRWLVDVGEVPSMDDLKKIVEYIIKIAKEENKLIVVTGDCHYCDPSDKVYRDVIINAKQVGNNLHPLNFYRRAKMDFFENPDQHYRTTDEMLKAFDWLDPKEAFEYVVTNSNKVADMCEEIIPVKTDTYTPKIENSEKLLTDLVYGNAHKLYGDNLPKVIEDRIKSELDGIINNGYSVIYYIAYELVKKANDDGYIVGSRGSVGSSLVATLADITEVNPLPPHYRCPNCRHVEFYEDDTSMSGFDLPEKNCPICGTKMIGDGQSIPFQTFLGFNADKTPDIDLNFPTDYQSTAHNYTKVLLGAQNVYRAGTIGTVQFKTAYGYVRKYFEEFLHQNPDSINGSRIASIAYGCTEIKRTTGQHPAGIVVVPNGYDINDFTPVQYPADDIMAAWKTTHFDFTSMHDTLLKLDILGHVDPQALKMMCDLSKVNIKDIPIGDKKVLSLFTVDDALNLRHLYLPKDNGALGLPEFGTDFVRQVLREAQPKTVKDLVIISGLTHGTDVWNNNAEDLIQNKVTTLNGVIGCRDDIMTYLISKGLEPHNAFVIMETVRKKDKQLKAEQIKDMLDHNVPDYYIESCKKIKYLFPKGHATAYVMMALRVGYFKVYRPLEYYATFFTLRCDEYDIGVMVGGIDKVHEKLEELYRRRQSKNPEDKLSVKESALITTLEVTLEMYERGIKLNNITIEKSDGFSFLIDKENNALIPPFKVIAGMGASACNDLINARNEAMFTSKEDLIKRGKISTSVAKILTSLHVLDDLKESDQLSLFDFNF